jgi:acyl dehydratase
MTGEQAETKPKGIFNRASKGMRLDPVIVPVERGRIRFFASVLGLTDPIHFDVEKARAKGYPDLVAPPSFFMPIEAAANEERERLGRLPILKLINGDYRYLLHGDETYEYHGLIFAGDEVTLITTIGDFYEKKSGAMEFVTIESELSHPKRGLLVHAKRTLLHRLA